MSPASASGSWCGELVRWCEDEWLAPDGLWWWWWPLLAAAAVAVKDETVRDRLETAVVGLAREALRTGGSETPPPGPEVEAESRVWEPGASSSIAIRSPSSTKCCGTDTRDRDRTAPAEAEAEAEAWIFGRNSLTSASSRSALSLCTPGQPFFRV
jgi:hypothetical protein